MKNNSLRISLVAALAGLAGVAHAVEEAGTIGVSAEVTASCTRVTAPLAFGSYGATSDLDATTDLSLTCSNGTTYEIALDAGGGTDATTTARLMTGGTGTDTLNYALYRDTGRTEAWGNITSTDTVTGTGSGAEETITVYGRVPQGQYQPVGSYSDTVNVTVTY